MTKHTSRSIFVLLSLVLSTSIAGNVYADTLYASAKKQTFVTPSGVTLLTETEFRQKVVNNTLTGKTRTGGSYYEYFTEEDRIVGFVRKTKYYGKWEWEANNPVVCFDYRDGSEYDHCSLLELKGNTVVYYDLEGRVKWEATVLEGNTRNL